MKCIECKKGEIVGDMVNKSYLCTNCGLIFIEKWMPIIGYEGSYKVSNFGNIKSLKRVVKNSLNGTRVVKEKILKLQKDKDKYLSVGLCRNSIMKTFKVHRLVAQAFIVNPLNKPQVNHINGTKIDNRVENLEYVTARENTQHSWVMGLQNNHTLRKKVLMLSLDNEPLLWFDSIAEASKNTYIVRSSISSRCRGVGKTAGGYKWEYYNG